MRARPKYLQPLFERVVKLYCQFTTRDFIEFISSIAPFLYVRRRNLYISDRPAARPLIGPAHPTFTIATYIFCRRTS